MAHSDTISIVSNRPSGAAIKRPGETRLLVTTAKIVDVLLIVWFIDIWFNATMWLRFAHSVLFRDQARSPDHIVVPVQKSERTSPHEGSVSERLETGTWRCQYQ